MTINTPWFYAGVKAPIRSYVHIYPLPITLTRQLLSGEAHIQSLPYTDQQVQVASCCVVGEGCITTSA